MALNVNPHVMHESYAHEVSSAGFWPDDETKPPMFYSYAVPEPRGFRDARVPPSATYNEQLREFVLPHEAVRASTDPDATLLAFLQSTNDAAASLGDWDRALLEEWPPCACEVAKTSGDHARYAAARWSISARRDIRATRTPRVQLVTSAVSACSSAAVRGRDIETSLPVRTRTRGCTKGARRRASGPNRQTRR
jgi:hypothetical protein